jgi:galacturonosyltransferase
MKKVLILANHFITIYAFRRELVKRLLELGYHVTLALPYSSEVDYFSNMGCEIIDTPLERRKTNPLNDFKLLFQYYKIIKAVKPDVVLTYTIKPNTYGGLAARLSKAKAIHTVTGLGSVYIQDMWQKRIAVRLNKIAFKNAKVVFFLNNDNKTFYEDMNIINSEQNTKIVPGSGVNLEKFKYHQLDIKDNITFTFVGRILRDKGIEEYFSAAKQIKKKYKNVKFEVVGFVDEEKYVELLERYEKDDIIHYLGKRDDVPEIMSNSTCIVLPSYGEGRGTVLQEGAAIGRPLITCNTYGCKENVEDGKNGYLCKVADSISLEKSLDKFINLSNEEKLRMGKYSREKAENEFDRNIVINSYINEINNIIEMKE